MAPMQPLNQPFRAFLIPFAAAGMINLKRLQNIKCSVATWHSLLTIYRNSSNLRRCQVAGGMDVRGTPTHYPDQPIAASECDQPKAEEGQAQSAGFGDGSGQPSQRHPAADGPDQCGGTGRSS